MGPHLSIRAEDSSYDLTDVEIRVDDHGTTGPFLVSFTTPAWRIAYRADFGDAGLTYAPIEQDASVETSRTTTPLEQWINKHKPSLLLEGDRLITSEDKLLEPRYDRQPFDRQRLMVLDWAGVNLGVESQGPERRADSVQNYMARHLQGLYEFDLLIDDDGNGEAADRVCCTDW